MVHVVLELTPDEMRPPGSVTEHNTTVLIRVGDRCVVHNACERDETRGRLRMEVPELRALLEQEGLAACLPLLEDVSTPALLELERAALLTFLKERGVIKLAERQKLANALSRVKREAAARARVAEPEAAGPPPPNGSLWQVWSACSRAFVERTPLEEPPAVAPAAAPVAAVTAATENEYRDAED